MEIQNLDAFIQTLLTKEFTRSLESEEIKHVSIRKNDIEVSTDAEYSEYLASRDVHSLAILGLEQ